MNIKTETSRTNRRNFRASTRHAAESDGKMHERGKYMKERGIKNIVHTKEKDRYFIVVDEGAVLAPAKGLPRAHNKMLEECQYMISHIARVEGHLVSYCLLYAISYRRYIAKGSKTDGERETRLPFTDSYRIRGCNRSVRIRTTTIYSRKSYIYEGKLHRTASAVYR